MYCLRLIEQKSSLGRMRRKFRGGRLQGLTSLQEMGSVPCIIEIVICKRVLQHLLYIPEVAPTFQLGKHI